MTLLNKDKVALSEALDLDILTQYIQAIGGQALLGSVGIFEQQFPLYIDNLISCHLRGDNKGLIEEAHKMKGAAGAVGLLRLGVLSQKIQNSSADNWQDNCLDYIKSIQQHYVGDIILLREYLVSQ